MPAISPSCAPVLRCVLADPAATDLLGRALADVLQPGLLVTLEGPLGSGKTHLVRALLQALGHAGRVKSPTYTVMEPYLLAWGAVSHFDFYRFADGQEADDAGLREEFNAHTLCLVEWPSRAAAWLPAAALALDWQPAEQGRVVRLTCGPGLAPVSVQAALARAGLAWTCDD